MNKQKTTKRALLLSALAMLLSVTMLIGTTFAWFTDSVASGNNVITSGNLDLEVDYTLDGQNWTALDDASDLFEKDLWEPGHTEVVALKIKNVGSLAFKYVVCMNVIEEFVGKNKNGEDIVLSDILEVSTVLQQVGTIGDILLELAFTGENAGGIDYSEPVAFKNASILKQDQNIQPGEEQYLIIKIDMPETLGNEANHNGINVPAIEFGVNVLATQYGYESDTFGTGYDKNAEYPALPEVYPAASANELKDAIANAQPGDIVRVTSDINSPTYMTIDKPITIDLGGNTYTAEFSNATLNLKNGASIKNGTVASTTPVSAIRVMGSGSSIEDVTINVTPKADRVVTGIAITNGNYVKAIRNVTITGVSQGIELGKGAKVDLIENATITAVSNGVNPNSGAVANGIGLVVNSGYVGKVVNSTFNGEVYGADVLLSGTYDVGVTFENCKLQGGTAALFARDEAGIANNSNCSLTINYDDATKNNSGVIDWSFESECLPVVKINNATPTVTP